MGTFAKPKGNTEPLELGSKKFGAFASWVEELAKLQMVGDDDDEFEVPDFILPYYGN